jgi:DNA-binding transcriptional ArsR family regulator
VTPDIDRTLSALADPTRRAVIEKLRQGPRRASDLAESIGASNPAMSRHLRVLRTAGLVEIKDQTARGDARERWFGLSQAPFEQLRGWLEEVEQFWSVQLASFKKHVERTRGRKR